MNKTLLRTLAQDSKIKQGLSLLLAVFLLSAVSAFADTIYTNTDTNNGFTFNSTLDVGASCGVNCTNYKYTLTINTNGTVEADVDWIAVQLFEGTDTISSDTVPSGWSAFANSFPGTQCGSVSHTGAECADDNGTSPFDLKTTGANSSVTLVFNGTFQGGLDTTSDINGCSSTSGFCIDLQARATNVGANGNAFAPSDSLGLTLQSTPTPEPASIALFGTGLFGLAGLLRRRITTSK